MESFMREKQIYNASVRGDVESLNNLLKEDDFILNDYGSSMEFCFNGTPMHIAATRGHVHFAKVLLQHKPDLVYELDSRLRSPLHLASAYGRVEMVKLLLHADPDVCLIEDEFGRTPLHLAAMVNGRVEVVNELVRARPESIMYPSNRIETVTILHSYVLRNGPKALSQLVEGDYSFLNSQDGEGNTILHKVVTFKKLENDDVAELEWLWNFVDDSFSDFPVNNMIGTANFRSDTQFHGRSRIKRSRAVSTNTSWNSTLEFHSQIAGKSIPNAGNMRIKKENSSSSSGIARDRSSSSADSSDLVERRCTHCASEKTPQWRTGPLGPKTLCNACGVRYKSGRLVPEYRPAASPTFVLTQHSNSHRKVMELRQQKQPEHQLLATNQ